MFKLLKTVFKAGDVTTKYPFKPYEVDDDFRGKTGTQFGSMYCLRGLYHCLSSQCVDDENGSP